MVEFKRTLLLIECWTYLNGGKKKKRNYKDEYWRINYEEGKWSKIKQVNSWKEID